MTATTPPATRPPGPGHSHPPVLTVVHDHQDDHAFMTAALAAHDPALGRITVHPTPGASAPAALAHDLLRSLGRHSPLVGSQDAASWATNAQSAWRAVAAWILGLRITHLVVTRAHRIGARHFQDLLALRELTAIRVTLVCHGPLPAAQAAVLKALPHEALHTLGDLRAALSVPAGPPLAGTFAWWTGGEEVWPHPGEPCFLLPTRRGPGPAAVRAAARHLGRRMITLPAGGRFPHDPDEDTALLARRIHTRIAHPVRAAALAVQVFTGRPAGEWAQTAPPPLDASGTTGARADRHPKPPSWAADLVESALHFVRLEGHTPAVRPLRLSPWDHRALTEAAGTCGLHEHQTPGRPR
ncbi:hypothetical protein [Streptomyces sp. NPDC056544]|uniref:hypothetical protein n=1 Tax=unclassified Streptomyces TaxID=2593676 RepID=UPI00368B1079